MTTSPSLGRWQLHHRRAITWLRTTSSSSPSSCHHPADDAGSWTRRCWWNYGKCMKVICVCYIFCSSLINIIIFHSILDSVADGHCAGADGTWWQLWSRHPHWWHCCRWGDTNMVAALMLVIAMVTIDDGSCNNGFDGDGTSRWRRQLLCWRWGNNIRMAAAVKPCRIIIIVANDNDNMISMY